MRRRRNKICSTWVQVSVLCHMSVYYTVMSGVWYSDVWCMIQWWLVYDTEDRGVRCTGYDTAQFAIAFHRPWSLYHCIIHQTSMHHTPDINVSYTRHHCIIHPTSMYHTPDITVSYTRLCCIIHQTSTYNTPDIRDINVSYTDFTVPYTTHQCITH